MPSHSLSLKSKLSLFTALLFVSTVMVLAFKLEREVRSEFETCRTSRWTSAAWTMRTRCSDAADH